MHHLTEFISTWLSDRRRSNAIKTAAHREAIQVPHRPRDNSDEGGQASLSRPKSGAHSPAETPQYKGLQTQIDELRVRVARLEQHKPSASSELSHTKFVHEVVRARRDRSALFGPELLGEPAWDILLELYAAELDRHRVLVSKVGKESGIAETTAFRWLERLDAEGWLTRVPDPKRRRRVFVMLTGRGSAAMRAYVDKQLALRRHA